MAVWLCCNEVLGKLLRSRNRQNFLMLVGSSPCRCQTIVIVRPSLHISTSMSSRAHLTSGGGHKDHQLPLRQLSDRKSIHGHDAWMIVSQLGLSADSFSHILQHACCQNKQHHASTDLEQHLT